MIERSWRNSPIIVYSLCLNLSIGKSSFLLGRLCYTAGTLLLQCSVPDPPQGSEPAKSPPPPRSATMVAPGARTALRCHAGSLSQQAAGLQQSMWRDGRLLKTCPTPPKFWKAWRRAGQLQMGPVKDQTMDSIRSEQRRPPPAPTPSSKRQRG